MSLTLVDKAGLRWWTEEELEMRDYFFKRLNTVIQKTLLKINRAWSFHRVESPMLVPISMVSPAYDTNDIFFTEDHPYAMRPETTAGSYRYLDHILRTTKVKPPVCIYQIGKSFRVEKADGASASKMRYNEFTQAEWQCLFSKTTMADYKNEIITQLLYELSVIFPNQYIHDELSDRLPDYSLQTVDILIDRIVKNRRTEVVSISTRKDYHDDFYVLEIAFGIDRLVDIWVEYQKFIEGATRTTY